MMSKPGNSAVHQAPWLMEPFVEASDKTLPQVGTKLDFRPVPMKVREASRMIASATSTVAKTRTGAAVLRTTCFVKIQGALAPETITART